MYNDIFEPECIIDGCSSICSSGYSCPHRMSEDYEETDSEDERRIFEEHKADYRFFYPPDEEETGKRSPWWIPDEETDTWSGCSFSESEKHLFIVSIPSSSKLAPSV